MHSSVHRGSPRSVECRVRSRTEPDPIAGVVLGQELKLEYPESPEGLLQRNREATER